MKSGRSEMKPREARSVCLRADVESTLAELRRKDIGAAALRELLCCRAESEGSAWSDVVELSDVHGRRTEVAVHVPTHTRGQSLGALIVLHGAGGSGEHALPYFSSLGDRLSMAVVCPTAQLPPSPESNNLDVAGIFGKRFTRPRWDLAGRDFPLAALRWARTQLDVDPNRCALAGVSMGGLATWNLSMRFWHSFSAAVPINGALSIWESFGTDRRTRALLPNTLPLSMFVVHGSSDEQIPPQFDRDSVAALRDLGHDDLEYIEVSGGEHGLATLGMEQGSPLFYRLERWLGRRRRAHQPVEIRHRAHDDQHGRAHWVRISGIGPQQVADVRARRIAPDRIDVEVSDASQVELHLRSEWLKPGDIVGVSINGAISTVRFEPDLATVVKSFQDTGDPELVAEQIVSLAVPHSSVNAPFDTRARRGHAHSS
jgi:poly(3-hydroxybutyrate) depolymerase